MSRHMKLGIGVIFAAIAIGYTAMFVSTHDIAVLNPAGAIGRQQRDLMAVTVLLVLLVIIPVFVMTFLIAWRYRASNTKATYSPEMDGSKVLESIWWGVPIIIIMILSVITWKSSHELDPYQALDSNVKPLRVQVIALQWKWLFLYPDEGIATVNYLQIPEQTPINFEVTADAPMNSFWIPKLGSQVYAMAGMSTKLHLIADHQGTFTGSSANISGEGFADMTFTTRAVSRDAFAAWAKQARADSKLLSESDYDDLTKPGVLTGRPVYTLGHHDLYDRAIMKYMMPEGVMDHADDGHSN